MVWMPMGFLSAKRARRDNTWTFSSIIGTSSWRLQLFRRWRSCSFAAASFSSLVDDALDEMRDMLDKNEAVKAFVNREDM